jgi:hypothetical protein
MEKFIRLDVIGQWRGSEHNSMFGQAEETITEYDYEYDFETGENILVSKEIPAGAWEKGISCYELKDIAYAIEKLREYWMGIACFTNVSDYEDMQVTIFEGERVYDGFQKAYGADYEDLAECTNTLYELDAVDFMSKVFAACEKFEDDEITEDEYYNTLEIIYHNAIANQYKRVG